jgi:hypothetical protein
MANGLSRHRTPLTILGLFVANSLYLSLTDSASIFYAANVLLHFGGGMVFAVIWARLLLQYSKDDSLDPSVRRLAMLALGVVLVAAASAVAIVVLGNLHATRPVVWTHVITAAAATGLTAWIVMRRSSPRSALPIGGVTFVAVVMVYFSASDGRPLGPGKITNPDLPPPDMAAEAMGGVDGPFFPSSAETANGELIPSKFFMESESCGRSGCHPDIVEQWASSAHRFSSFNNQWYRKSIEYMQEVVGTQAPQWCAGCHDHALLFSGKMAQPVSDFIETPEAHAGLGCVSCHSVVDVKGSMGNGGIVVEFPPLHELATSKNPVAEAIHDLVVRLDPGPHRATFLKDFHREQTAEFCSSCHKVHLDRPVNQYRWIRGFNTYDNWQASGVSHEGARSFYAPPSPQDCATCHMPLVASGDAGNQDGFVHNHRFIAANTALPVVNEDSVQLAETLRFLQASQLRVDIFALTEPSPLPAAQESAPLDRQVPETASTFAVGEEQQMDVGAGGLTTSVQDITGDLSDDMPLLEPGSTARLDVVVRTLGLGHFFPTGTVDAQEAWLELKATDSNGRVILWSGHVEADGRGAVDSTAHFYRSRMVDARGNPINKRNAWAARSIVYVNLIPPGAADVAHYRLNIPDDVGDTVRIEARLNYRKFDLWNTRFSFQGRRDPDQGDYEVSPHFDDGRWIFASDGQTDGNDAYPFLPIVTMAADTLTLRVTSKADSVAAGQDRDSRAPDPTRWNDYGIGLLLQGDLLGAERAFRQVGLDARGWLDQPRPRISAGW